MKKRERERREEIKEARERKGSSLKKVSVSTATGAPHWGGSGDILQQFVEPFMVRRELPIGSGKRTPAQNRAVGGSRHLRPPHNEGDDRRARLPDLLR